MSVFSYKGIDVYTITTGGGTSVPGYNFNGVSTGYNGLKPNDFGFSYQGTSLRNYCTTPTTSIYNSPGSVTVPANCKSVSIIAVGGQGGPGGRGGTGTRPRSGQGPWPGGPGGTGGKGTQINTPQSIITGTINFTTGNTGNTGTPGWNPGDQANNNGNQGGPGGSGNATIIYTSSGTYNAPGGNGGGGGNGGQANNSSPGSPGSPGNTPASPYPNPENYPPRNNGQVQIIWFYS
jgi:hypothetical protein